MEHLDIVIVENVDGITFHEAISTAMKNDKRGKFVEIHTVGEYDDMKLLVSLGDGTAGIAVTKDNNIVSLFENKEAPLSETIKALDLLIPVAVMHGGIKMDCYGGHLTRRYMEHGFVPVARCLFDEEHAPTGWDYKKHGKPDIYFLVRFTRDIDALVRESSPYNSSYFDFMKDALPYMDYKDAVAYTAQKVKEISESDNTSYKRVIEQIISGNVLHQEGGSLKL